MGRYVYCGLGVLLAKGRAAALDGVTQSGEALLAKAQNGPNMPVETGTLRASGTVEASRSGMSAQAVVSFGGESADYAIFQHEGTSRGVPATKFLEAPLIAHAPEHVEIMAAAMKGQF